MATKEQILFTFLCDPASCRIYSNETRQRHADEAPQTNDEARAAERMYPKPAYQAAAWNDESRIAFADAMRERTLNVSSYRSPVTPRTLEQTVEIMHKLARKGARPDYLRTDPWEGIDVNPWRITEKERIRFGLGPFR